MRRASDKVVLAVAQRGVGAIDRKDQLGRDRDARVCEEPELGCRQGGKYEFEIRSGIASFIAVRIANF